METELEHILINSHKPDMIAYLAIHPKGFDELVKLAIADKQPYSWRASWHLWSCMEINDKRILKYVKELIEILPKRKDNQQRELLKILQQMEIKEELEGSLFNHCVKVWRTINKQVSVRFNAFKMLAKIAQRHPDLSLEVISLTNFQYVDSLSRTAKKSIFEMIKELE